MPASARPPAPPCFGRRRPPHLWETFNLYRNRGGGTAGVLGTSPESSLPLSVPTVPGLGLGAVCALFRSVAVSLFECSTVGWAPVNQAVFQQLPLGGVSCGGTTLPPSRGDRERSHDELATLKNSPDLGAHPTRRAAFYFHLGGLTQRLSDALRCLDHPVLSTARLGCRRFLSSSLRDFQNKWPIIP